MGRHEDLSSARPDVVPVDRRRSGLDRASIAPAVLVFVLAVVMALVIGVVNELVPGDDEVRPGDVIELAGGVEFVPATGWDIADGVRAGQAGSAGSYPAAAQVTDGAVALGLQSAPWSGDAAALLEQVRRTNESLAGKTGPRVEGGVATFRTDAGAEGVLSRYRSPGTDGVLAAVVLAGAEGRVGVAVVATGPVDAPETVAPEVVGMIESIAVVDGDAR
jgi:hypothetical protein